MINHTDARKAPSVLAVTLSIIFLILPGISFAIDFPSNLRGTVISQSEIFWEWDWVPGVDQYEVTVDGNVVGFTRDPRYTSTGLWAGEHSLSVKAIDKWWSYSWPAPTIKVNTANAQGTNSPGVLADAPSNSGNSSSSSAIPQNLRATQTGQGTVRWDWDAAAGAVKYEVTVDGLYAGETNSTSYTSSNLWVGDHSLTVKSISSTGSFSQSSTTLKTFVQQMDNGATSNAAQPESAPANSAPVSNGSLTKPTNLRGSQIAAGTVRWEWDWIASAAKYEVTVDGQYAGETTSTNYSSSNLWVGDHSLRIRAIGTDGSFSQASDDLKFYVQAMDNQQSNANTQAAPPQTNNSANDTGVIDPTSWTYGEVYQKPGYELSFSDEFNGSSLNPNRWNTQLRWDGEFNGERYEYRVVNGEDQFYVNIFSPDGGHKDTVVPLHNPFEFNGSRLAIRAVKNPAKLWDGNAGHGDLYSMLSQQTFLSGAISTYDKFTQKYGYFEARIKIPGHVGAFPAFWLHHQKRKSEGTQRTEIDIMENLGHAPWYIYNTFHYFTNVSETYSGDDRMLKPQPDGQIYTGTDYSNGFHTYAVEWSPGYVAWFIDDVKVSELWDSNVDYEDLYLILNLAIGGNWTNFPASSGGLGRSTDQYYPTQNDINNFQNPALEIDYVRVYKKK